MVPSGLNGCEMSDCAFAEGVVNTQVDSELRRCLNSEEGPSKSVSYFVFSSSPETLTAVSNSCFSN